MVRALHIDCFTALDDIKGKDRGNPRLVLRTIMQNGGRFSAFDASDITMARTLTYIEGNSGWTNRVARDSHYPWVRVELTEAGRAALANE